MPTSRGPGRPSRRRGTNRTRPRAVGAAGGNRPGTRLRQRGATAPIRRSTRPRSLRRLVALGAILIFLAVFLMPTVRAYLDQRGQIEQMTEQVAQQRQEVAELQEDVQAWDDPAYVEQQARERLKFVRPGETSYTVLDDVSEDGPEADAMGDEVQQDRPWYGALWDSVVTANESASEGQDGAEDEPEDASTPPDADPGAG